MKLSKVFNLLTKRDKFSDAEPLLLADPIAPQEQVFTTPQQAVTNRYISSAPSPQNALDIFHGEWSSVLPEPLAHLSAGAAQLFSDVRIDWLVETIGGVVDKNVLELGPLEGGHTYMLEKLGASSIVAIESNTHAFLKSLIIKELFELKRSRFLYGDFIEFLRQEDTPSFQVCLASGVLYHMQKPAELIALLSRHCLEHLFLWTHYYDAAIIAANPSLLPKFNDSTQSDYEGFQHTLYRQEYQTALTWSGFCGGNAPISAWMTRADIIRCLEYFGFEVLGINFDQPDHQNGPALALIAKRCRKASS
ncbi:MAG: class I SAM-dependent methyltransferase [Lyngbya sp. HA4199-MV5]|jgi:hypothetical protein|nr:class I SAM-dependent methyltransferase [Lyngbya sp. HA4199-MV5]